MEQSGIWFAPRINTWSPKFLKFFLKFFKARTGKTFLGITFNSKFNFDDHVTYFSKSKKRQGNYMSLTIIESYINHKTMKAFIC